MVICGLNLRHDGAVAVVDGNRLLVSLEAEKVGSGNRYDEIDDLGQIAEMLATEGMRLKDIDQFVVCGWTHRVGELSWIEKQQDGEVFWVSAAPYTDDCEERGLLNRYMREGIPGGALAGGYASYTHVSNHVVGAYCTSPFARQREASYVLAWDGCIFPRLYWIEAQPFRTRYLGWLMPLTGQYFQTFCEQFEAFNVNPYRPRRELFRGHQEVPGKAMAYAALGNSDAAVFPVLDGLIDECLKPREAPFFQVGAVVGSRVRSLLPGMSDADLIATCQEHIGQRLVSHLARLLHGRPKSGRPKLCIAGGCGLNIKWNSMIRRSGLFSEIWVPPFPNDSGAALGMACCEMAQIGPEVALDWEVYSGPKLASEFVPRNWVSRACDEAQLARVLHEEDEPVVVLFGRAELGPRALGNRSILAPAVHAHMKDRLNAIKKRSSYRPVAPLCLESRAKDIFDPGCKDPYMLFEHRVRPEWAARLPAIVHLDGTARLQTVDPENANTAAGGILREYAALSGIPVLCNTSANLPGHGFFQHPLAASEWGQTRYVWANGVLYTNPNAPATSRETSEAVASDACAGRCGS